MNYYIGIDNGVTGSVCVLDESGKCLEYWPTPVEKTLNYTKVKEYITRVQGNILGKKLRPYAETGTVVIERPLVNPGRWKATVSALRCDEATRIVLEILGLRFIYVDSREWQSVMLPKRKSLPAVSRSMTAAEKTAHKTKATAFKKETKELSLMVAQRLFPQIAFSKDGDAALMAEWARRQRM